MMKNYIIFMAVSLLFSELMAQDLAVKAVPAPVVTPLAKTDAPPQKALNTQEMQKYERENFYGRAVRGAKGELLHVEENEKQTHSKEHTVVLQIKGIKNGKGRIRVVVWDKPDNYGQEGRIPFRAVSFPASESKDGMMLFKIGLEKDKSYSFFAHHDENDDGKVNRIFGIPTEPYVFTNEKTQGKGEGLKRVGLSPPPFERTLVRFTGAGQMVEMNF